MKIERTTPEHLAKIEPRRYEKETAEEMGVRIGELSSIMACGPCFTFIDGEMIVAIAGLASVWGKVWEAWLISTPYITSKTGVAIKRKMEELIEDLGPKIQRLQASVAVTHSSAHRWIEWLGMKPEARLKNYSVLGEDVMMYARIYKWE